MKYPTTWWMPRNRLWKIKYIFSCSMDGSWTRHIAWECRDTGRSCIRSLWHKGHRWQGGDIVRGSGLFRPAHHKEPISKQEQAQRNCELRNYRKESPKRCCKRRAGWLNNGGGRCNYVILGHVFFVELFFIRPATATTIFLYHKIMLHNPITKPARRPHVISKTIW